VDAAGESVRPAFGRVRVQLDERCVIALVATKGRGTTPRTDRPPCGCESSAPPRRPRGLHRHEVQPAAIATRPARILGEVVALSAASALQIAAQVTLVVRAWSGSVGGVGHDGRRGLAGLSEGPGPPAFGRRCIAALPPGTRAPRLVQPGITRPYSLCPCRVKSGYPPKKNARGATPPYSLATAMTSAPAAIKTPQDDLQV